MKAMCERCGGGGHVYVPRATQDDDGRMGTSMVQEACGHCGGVGWLPFPGTVLTR